jgi:hypothetical protein
MFTFRLAVVAPLVLYLSAGSPVFAQNRHVVDPSAIGQMVDQRVMQQDADRAAIREALAQPEVRQLASRAGIDLDRASAMVATLSGSDLATTAAAARHVNDALAGGASTVVISTTTIIIALLVLIVLIVALK